MLLCENIVLLCIFCPQRFASGQGLDPPDLLLDFFGGDARIIAVEGPILSIVERSGAVKGG